MKHYLILIITIGFFFQCCQKPLEADLLIKGGTLILGDGSEPYEGDVAVAGDRIIFVGQSQGMPINAKHTIQATGKIVSPGFIDPHTHSLGDLKKKDKSANLNYITQGVTTVMNGNDGEGPFDIAGIEARLMKNGIGTNTAFLVGHGTIRTAILGKEEVAPSDIELDSMKALVRQAMKEGAFGLSTGLYYSPGSFADTDEIISLAKEVAPFGGLYESHIRDESSYNIGLLNAVDETIRIGKEAGVPVHFAHIKALGVDVWGKSKDVISKIEEAQEGGMIITADQYPWIASGTHLENALINRWVMAGGEQEYYKRLDDQKLLPRIKSEIKENIRKRGGKEALLIIADCEDESMIGMNLGQVALRMNLDPVDAALNIARMGGARVASYNMTPDDLKNFMRQPWVMTSSDGTKGHPRKYASFPQKYEQYVMKEKVLTLEDFVYKCSGLVAETFDMNRRGKLVQGNFADVIIWDANNFKSNADFTYPRKLSSGIEHVFVNGIPVLANGELTGSLPGKVIKKNE